MAYSQEQWERAKAYYEAGQHNPQQISELVGIERSTIVKKAKIHNWKSGANADYIEARVKVAEKKSQLNSQILNVLDNIADEQIRHKSLIYSNAELIASQIPKMIDSMILKEIDEETGEVTEKLAITPTDLKIMAEANDRIAITLKVADRHAPKVEVNTQNNQLNNNQKVIKVQYE